MISSLLHLVGLGPRVYYTLTFFLGGQGPLGPPSIRQCLQKQFKPLLEKSQPSWKIFTPSPKLKQPQTVELNLNPSRKNPNPLWKNLDPSWKSSTLPEIIFSTPPENFTTTLKISQPLWIFHNHPPKLSLSLLKISQPLLKNFNLSRKFPTPPGKISLLSPPSR